MRFEPVSNCVCGGSRFLPFCTTVDRLHGVPGEFRYCRCLSCGTIFQNPQVVAEDIPQLYPEEYAPWTDLAKRAVTPGWKRMLRDVITITGLPRFARERLNVAGAALLDVGCGNGKFMARIANDHPTCQVEGLDFSPKAATSAGQAGFKVYVGTLPDLAPDLPSYDVVTMWWYLEHLKDPEEALRACYGLLKPGGYLACGVPNERSLGRVIFRGNWYHLDPPRHMWIFSAKSLGALLERIGFEVTYVRQDYSPWGIIGSAQHVIKGGTPDGGTWVDNPLMKMALRPVAVVQGLLHLGDTFTIYAKRRTS